MRKQRLMGIGFIAMAWVVLLLAYDGTTPEDQDATAALLIGPLGLYMLYSDTYILYDDELEPRARDSPAPLPTDIPPHQRQRKEPTHGKETSYRTPEH